MIRKLNVLIQLLRTRKFGYLLYFLKGYLFPKTVLAFLNNYPPPSRIRKWMQTSRNSKLYRLQESDQDLFTQWNEWQVPSTVRAKANACMSEFGRDVVLGEVDNDGRLLRKFGNLPGWAEVSPENFVSRKRFKIEVVLRDGCVLIRKNFLGDRKLFNQEWHNLAFLQGKANVPTVYWADEPNTILYKNLIPGRTIRDILVDAGAEILSTQTDNDPSLRSLPATERLHTILARGTKRLTECLPPTFFCELETQIDNIHREGIAGLSLTFGNVMVNVNGHPWLIDLEGVEAYPSTDHPIFLWQRDQDRQKYNRIYGRSLITEASARDTLNCHKEKLGGWYAPIDFGNGLAIGGFWTVESGTGRWEYLNEKVMAPLIQGKRILDLGSNNGLMPLLMLRAGAREVVGLELSTELVESAQLVHQIFEWRDIRRYSFDIHQANMLDILTRDWGTFDVITALCTLYYLTPDEMAAVVRRSAELAPIMIVQANDHTRAEAADNKAQKSTLTFLKTLLENNGFPSIEVFAPPGFSRPILVGRRG